MLRIALVQPVQSERRPGAIAQQPLAPGTVGSRDAYRGIEGEAAAVFPLRHRLRVIARQQAAAHEPAQQPPAHLRLHLRDGGGIKAAGGMENDRARGGLEHAVDDRTVKVQVGIECGAEGLALLSPGAIDQSTSLRRRFTAMNDALNSWCEDAKLAA